MTWVNRYGISVSQMTTDIFRLSLSPPWHGLTVTEYRCHKWPRICSVCRYHHHGMGWLLRNIGVTNDLGYVPVVVITTTAWVNRYGLSVSQMTTDMFRLSLSPPWHGLTVTEYRCHKWPRFRLSLSQSFPYLIQDITGFVTRVTRQMPLWRRNCLLFRSTCV